MEKVSNIIKNKYAFYLANQLRKYTPARRDISEKDFKG
jgi:hypothetical protein